MHQGEAIYEPKVHFSLVSLFFGNFCFSCPRQMLVCKPISHSSPQLRLGLNSLSQPIPEDLAKYGKSLDKYTAHRSRLPSLRSCSSLQVLPPLMTL